MTPAENATAARALRLALIDSMVAEKGIEIGRDRWAALDDRERMRRIGTIRAARAVLGNVVRYVMADIMDTAEDVEARHARRARRRPVLSLVEGSRIVSPEERDARERDPDVPPPSLILVP